MVRIRRYQHRSLSRTHHSRRTLAWFSSVATKLRTTPKIVENLLRSGLTSDQVSSSTVRGPANTVAPTVTGTAQVGQVLTGTAGTFTGTPTPTYAGAWLRDNVVIAGATAATYTPVAADVGKRLSYRRTATNAYGTVSATSTQTAAVIAAAAPPEG